MLYTYIHIHIIHMVDAWLFPVKFNVCLFVPIPKISLMRQLNTLIHFARNTQKKRQIFFFYLHCNRIQFKRNSIQFFFIFFHFCVVLLLFIIIFFFFVRSFVRVYLLCVSKTCVFIA